MSKILKEFSTGHRGIQIDFSFMLAPNLTRYMVVPMLFDQEWCINTIVKKHHTSDICKLSKHVDFMTLSDNILLYRENIAIVFAIVFAMSVFLLLMWTRKIHV
jgi:hypothetical protein